MAWKITITVKEKSTPEVFVIDDHDKRLVTFMGAGEPQEWAKTVEDVEKSVWTNVHNIGAYTQVIDDRSVTIPLDNILKIEITKC